MPPPIDVWLAASAAAVIIAGSVLAATIQQPPRPLDIWAVLLMVAAAGALAWRRCQRSTTRITRRGLEHRR